MIRRILASIVLPLVVVSAAWAADPAERAASTWPPKGKPVKVKVTRDTWLSSVGQERVSSNGGASQCKLKGQQEYTVFDIDADALKGKVITGAIWHFHSATPTDAPILRVSVSTISSPWVEGTSSGYKKQAGSSSYAQATQDQRDWSFPGSTLMDVCLGRGHTIWRFAESTAPDQKGWQSAAVEPDVVAARVAGLSHGFVAYDDVGNIWTYKDGKFKFTYFLNRFIHSREQNAFAPYLEVWTDGEDAQPPAAVTDVKVVTEGFPAGEALVTWKTPADTGGGKTLGFNVSYSVDGKTTAMPRYLIPMAKAAGEAVRMHIQDLPLAAGQEIGLTIAAVDSAGNVGPAVTKAVKVSAIPRVFKIAPSGLKPFAASEKLPAVGGLTVGVADETDKVHPVTGAMIPSHPKGYLGGNHLFSAGKKLIRLQAARNEHVAFQAVLFGRSDKAEVELSFGDGSIKSRLYRLDVVGTKSGPLPDVAVPLDGPVSVPPKGDPQAAGAKNVSLLAEVYVPHDAKAGPHAGTLTINSGGQRLELAVELTVWDFTLPNKLSFVPEMNAYGTVGPTGGGLAYYRLAHEHRTCLNRLYYGWTGSPNNAPGWNGRTLDFAQWDKWFGPLLDGSAFKDLPRSGEPVDAMYLPFNENWPMDVYKHYTPNYWADETFKPGYAEGLKKAFAAMATHCNEKGWHDTAFQFYLNNKVYHKKERGWRVSSAPWIFDEPVGTQDFWALRWYGILWRQAVDPVRGKAKMWYRTDISYSHFGRNLMWGMQDLVFFGGSNEQKVRQKHDEQVLYKPTYFAEYGSANDPGDPNIQPVVWCLKAWSRGATGVLPWQTIGSAGNMAKGTPVGLFIPNGGRIVASVRLKAFRRGQQDVEYMTLLGDAFGQPQFAVAGGLSRWIDLRGRVIKTSESDAGTIRFDKADPAALWAVRAAAGKMLSDRKPPYKRVVLDRPTPPSGLGNLPDIGYVTVAPKVPSSKPDMD